MTTLIGCIPSCSPRCEAETLALHELGSSFTEFHRVQGYLAGPRSLRSVATAKKGSQTLARKRRIELLMCEAAVASEVEVDHSISQTMQMLREQNRGAFIPFIMAGDPDLDTTEKALLALDEEGADVIELGVPYSDPLADGPTIQASHSRGLDGGTTVDKVLSLVKRVTSKIKAPIVLFQYYNPILRKGPDQYCRLAKEVGAAGILVPDLSLEETGVMQEATKKAGLELVQLVTPTTPQSRMKRIAEISQGFVYLVSVTGVTGARETTQSRVEGLIKQLREVTDKSKSVAVGFGVSGPKQALELRKWGAEGVIVGSALVKILGESGSSEEGIRKLRELASSLRAAI